MWRVFAYTVAFLGLCLALFGALVGVFFVGKLFPEPDRLWICLTMIFGGLTMMEVVEPFLPPFALIERKEATSGWSRRDVAWWFGLLAILGAASLGVVLLVQGRFTWWSLAAGMTFILNGVVKLSSAWLRAREKMDKGSGTGPEKGPEKGTS